MTDEAMKLFVYGTLKKGQGNHRYLKDAHFLGTGRTLWSFKMLDSGFPVCIPSNDGHPVEGEIYEWFHEDHPEIIRNLDMLEGEGHMFKKTMVTVKQVPSGPLVPHIHQCYMYLGVPEYWSVPPGYTGFNAPHWLTDRGTLVFTP